jgi:hypothetical protein
MSTGLRLARAAYTAAEYPAGPEPKMSRWACFVAMIKAFNEVELSLKLE